MSEGPPQEQRESSEAKAFKIEHGTVSHFPWGEAFLNEYQKWDGANPERLNAAAEAVAEFFKESLENTELFHLAKDETAFPYTRVSLRELASNLLAKHTIGLQSETQNVHFSHSPKKKHVEVVMGSFMQMQQGHVFGYCEEAMHTLFRGLPRAMRALANGEEFEDTEVFTLGSPTNELGHISKKFETDALKNPKEALGKLYAEFAKAVLSDEKELEHMELKLTGFSMGSSFAAAAAEKLLEEKVVSQQSEKTEGVPHLTVLLNIPTGLERQFAKPLKVGWGFWKEARANNPLLKQIQDAEPTFTEELREYLHEEKRIPSHMQGTQKTGKERLLRSILLEVASSPKETYDNVKATKVIGLKDGTYGLDTDHITDEQRERLGYRYDDESDTTIKTIKSLQPRLLDRGYPHREFGYTGTHAYPFARPSEWKRWDAIGDTLSKLEKEKQDGQQRLADGEYLHS